MENKEEEIKNLEKQIEEEKVKNKEHIEKKKEKKKKRRVLKGFLIFIIILLIILIVGMWGFAFYVKDKFNKLNYVYVDKENIGISKVVKDKLDNYRNIAIFGIDTDAYNYNGNSRSDSIMIASINKETYDVNLVSIYRDTYVDVDENGKTILDKINHAYLYGGAENSLRTLNRALDLNIEEFVTVNFEAVVEVVDEIGGIELNITRDEVKHINGYIGDIDKLTNRNTKRIWNAGTQTVNGVQALAYSRIRYTEGADYRRTERQRVVLEKILEKAKTLSIADLNNLMDKLFPKVSTNIPQADILNTATKILNYNIKNNFGWPYKTKGYSSPTYYGVPITLESNVKRLYSELFGINNYEPSETVKEMSNRIIEKTGYGEDAGGDEYVNANL